MLRPGIVLKIVEWLKSNNSNAGLPLFFSNSKDFKTVENVTNVLNVNNFQNSRLLYFCHKKRLNTCSKAFKKFEKKLNFFVVYLHLITDSIRNTLYQIFKEKLFNRVSVVEIMQKNFYRLKDLRLQ